MAVLWLKHSLPEGGTSGYGCLCDGIRQHCDRGCQVQVGLSSRQFGMLFLVGTGTWAFMGCWHLPGSLSSARWLSKSLKLCWILEETARGALPDGSGEMYLVCEGWLAQPLHASSLANTRSSCGSQDEHPGSWTLNMKLTQLSTSAWKGLCYLSAGSTLQNSQPCNHLKTPWLP